MDGRAITRLRGVDFSVDTDGIATPWGTIDPVDLGGSTVTRATFKNAAFLRENEVHIGDALAVAADKRRVVEEDLPLLRTGDEESLRLPNACPKCGCDLRQLGDDLVCPSSACEIGRAA